MFLATRNFILFTVTLIAIALSVYQLESARSDLVFSQLIISNTPATYTRLARQPTVEASPVVIVAHGFAGSRQLMDSFSLNLAKAGYEVIAFDFEGHGRNPTPMSGDVTAIDGTTRLLVEETQRVIAAARESRGADVSIALLGHSMATDVLLRAAIAELDAGRRIETIVGISMFSEAVSDTIPKSLLIINGQWESRLRKPALEQLRLIDPQADEGDTAQGHDVTRRVVVAPFVEHVSVLYSAYAIQESIAWMDSVFARTSDNKTTRLGGWILLLLAGIVLAIKPLVNWLPASMPLSVPVSTRKYWLAVLVPALVTPFLAFLPAFSFLPVLVADYLLLHLVFFAALQFLILRPALRGLSASVLLGAMALVVWGIVVFGFALDRYAASFLPTAGRLNIIAVLCLGAIAFMMADSFVTEAGRALWWRRLVARLSFIVSLGIAAVIDPERLIFLLLILPVLILFYLVHGLMGRWVAQRCGPLASGIGLGICLAWALGVTFPLFVL